MRDARAVLGVTAGATPAQVLSAFRRHARTAHPDVDHAPGAAARFAALLAAYDVAHREAVDIDDRAGTTAGQASAGPRPPRDVVMGTGTAVREGGRPILLIGPVIMHASSTRGGGPEAESRD